MVSVIDILIVREDPCTEAGALLDSHGFVGCVREPSVAAAAFEQREPDCVVACTGVLPTALAGQASAAGVPIVGCGTDDTEALVSQVREAVASAEHERERGRITRLHESAVELVAVDDRDQLYDRTVALAGDVLDFDIAVIFHRDAAGFHRVATTDESVTKFREPDYGVIAKVYDTGESIFVDDIHENETARSHSKEYRSGLAVPFGEDGVFVGLSKTIAAFDNTDLELAELLASHAAQVDARLGAEEDLLERQRTITQLHEAAPSLINAETEQELFERVVGIAKRVLSFDRSSMFVRESEYFVSVAGHGEDIGRVPAEESILTRTYEEGRSFLVPDMDADTDAAPAYGSTQSGVSVPVGDDAVFQALSAKRGAFDEADLELAELLAAYAGATLSRIRSEQALRASRQVIERLHDTATDIAAADTEQAVLERSIDAAERVLEFEKSAIILRDGDLLVPAIESSQSPTNAARPMALSEGIGGKTYRTGETYRLDDLSAEVDADPVKDSYCSAISIPIGELGVFQAVANVPDAFDDDDVHLAELLMAHVAVSIERVRAEADLRSQRDRLEALFENVPGAAISYEMLDGEPIVRRVNGAFEETFGYDAESVIDRPLDDYIVPPDAETEAERYNTRLERGERIQAEVEREVPGGTRHFLLQVIPLSVGSENSSGYAIYTDVTKQREREAALRRQNERLDQFASVVSHDLRNPINVAAGYLDLARESGNQDHLERVSDAIDRMDELVEDLLRLAREGRDVGETTTVELASVAQTAWQHVPTDGASVRIEVDGTVDADNDRLVELFENLYRNSIEHGSTDSQADGADATEEADGAPIVRITNIEENGRLQGFAVSDDGPGIDPRTDPFETGTTTSETGTGFGLAIVKSIAEAHGWSVSAGESETGGARFEFRF